MKSLHPRSLLAVSALALPALAHAHPGHDGDHGLVWDFAHLADHPLATLACLSLLVAAGWGMWRMVKSRQSAKVSRAKRD